MKAKQSLIYCAAIILLITGSAGYAYAGIGVTPTITEIVVPADEPTERVFVAVNNGNETMHVKVEPENWLKRKTGIGDIPVEEWLTITPMEFDIGPNETRRIEYTLTPPAGYEGELVAMVFFSTTSPTKGAFGIINRFGVSVYAAIENTIELGCNINDITVKRNIIKKKEGQSIDRGIIFVMNVENQGNVHLRPTGSIVVRGEGEEVYKIELHRGFPIYPGKRLDYAVPWREKDIPPGRYNAKITLDYGKIYDLDKKIEDETSFFVGEDGSISF